jgi:anti-sigma factor RsiW
VDCARVDEELIGFQLAALDGATRAAVEAHLTGCSRCVSSFLALKRAIDVSEGATGPSEFMRMRIRKEAERQLSVVSPQPSAAAAERKPRRARWAIAAAAAAAAILIAPLVYRATRATPSPTVSAPSTAPPDVLPVNNTNNTVDTARVTPENLAFL